jgi:hypothetical protein
MSSQVKSSQVKSSQVKSKLCYDRIDHWRSRCKGRISGPSLLHTYIHTYVTTDGQLACLSSNKAPIWGLRPDIYYLCDSYGLVLVGRPLWQEVGSFFCMCSWSLPAQSFSGPSPLGLESQNWDFPFRRLLRLAGSRWRYSTPPPHG